MSDFQKGDVVQLKSGGELMTVADTGDYSGSGLGPEKGVKCYWFEGKKCQERVFDEKMLKKYTQQSMRTIRARLS